MIKISPRKHNKRERGVKVQTCGRAELTRARFAPVPTRNAYISRMLRPALSRAARLTKWNFCCKRAAIRGGEIRIYVT